MGVLLHPNYSGEQANGVAVSGDPVYGSEAGAYYVNAQVGEELVTNPSALAVPEELLLTTGADFRTTVLRYSNLVDDGVRILSAAHLAALHAALGTIHARFHALYSPGVDADFAMEIEFKITAEDSFAIKQARPWVGPLTPLAPPAAPGDFEAVPAGTGYPGVIFMAWDNPPDPEGLGYRIRVRKTTDTAWPPWQQLPDYVTTANAWKLDGLTSGVPYHIQLAAFNFMGQGPASEVTVTPF